jgi:SAM-dependent methyltransferase
MKVRDSGMPEEERWTDFFAPESILRLFGLDDGVGSLVDFGCGYGTFTIAAAKLVSGPVHALDIEPEMVETVRAKCRQEGLANVRTELRDFVGSGSGLAESTVDAALLFNILHHEDPTGLMGEAWRILRPGGRLAVIHWNNDPTTPRGPSLEIRPRPEKCIEWGRTAVFAFSEDERFDLRPHHYGLLFRKPGPNGRRS